MKLAYDRAIESPEYKVELDKLIVAREKIAEKKRTSSERKTEDKSASAAASTTLDVGSSSEDDKHKVKDFKLAASEGELSSDSDDGAKFRKTGGGLSIEAKNKTSVAITSTVPSGTKDDINIRNGGRPTEVQRAHNIRKALQRSSSFSGYSANIPQTLHTSKTKNTSPSIP